MNFVLFQPNISSDILTEYVKNRNARQSVNVTVRKLCVYAVQYQRNEVFTVAAKKKNAKEALNRFKMEAATEVGVNLKQGYNGDLTAKQAGSVGGQMVKKMIKAYEDGMK